MVEIFCPCFKKFEPKQQPGAILKLADSETGYTLQFSVYTGKRERPGPHGLAFDVVSSLCSEYLDQRYRIYMDNFYTSAKLLTICWSAKPLPVVPAEKITDVSQLS
ncbi:hypothetical protein HPB51_000303 [Rhipicephalus microplus]|uniref:PiggyBac transposable element-derived protein domain-containing protein n=1 Tax=Rhipicephalus microplus TaxID=6941 RepID=A0A9J6EJL0_RHIMP|nr:hypothetical protein HPB51_000303 [Rhipicephalus microplus]